MRYSSIAPHLYDLEDFRDPYTGRVSVREWQATHGGHGPGLDDDGGGFFSGISGAFEDLGHTVSSVANTVSNLPIIKQAIDVQKLAFKGAALLSKSPLWDIAQTGVSFIPGVGQAVSGGMAAAAALGKGASLRDAALTAAKNALPGGPAVAAAFDVATGMVHGKKFSDAFLDAAREHVPGGALGRAAFDAARAIASGKSLSQTALAVAQQNLPGGSEAQNAFNQAISVYHQVQRTAGSIGNTVAAFKQLSQPANLVAQKLAEARSMVHTPVRSLVDQGHPEKAAKDAIAGIMNRIRGTSTAGYDYRDVGELDSLGSCCRREGLNPEAFYADTSGPVAGPTFPARVMMSRPFLLGLYQQGHHGIKRAILAHGMLARVAHATGDLSYTGAYRLRPGETPHTVSHALTGGHGDVRQLRVVNPSARFVAGEVIRIPCGWLGTAMPASYTGAPSSTPETIRQGSTGPAVKQWQSIIGVTADGIFGPQTAAATKAWQAGHGLTADGIVGPQTWTRALSGAAPITSTPAATLLPPTIRQGSTGEAVRRWQQIVGVTVDGQFGPQTLAATKAFQLEHGLTVDGIVGPKTWTAGLAAAAAQAVSSAVPGLPAVPSMPAPLPTPVVASGAAQVSAAAVETLLATFFQKHVGELGSIPDAPMSPIFGTDPGDIAGAWNERATAAMRTFQLWKNGQGGDAMLPTTGQPDQLSVNALQAQVQADVSAASGGTIPANLPIPQIPAPASVPSVPVIPVTVTAPKPPAPKPPAMAPTPTPAASSSSSSSTGLLLAGGAALLLFGGGYGTGRRRRKAA